DFISVNIFHTPELSTALKIFSIAIPFTVLINVLIAIYRGFGRVDAKVYFQNIVRPVLYILFLVAVVLSGLSFLGVLCAYVLSIAVTCMVFVVYIVRKSPLPTRGGSVTNPMIRKLLSFSVPLLAVSMLMMVMSWTDTLMLGYFKAPDVVGVYNAALPLANLIPMVLTSLGFLYSPIASSLYGKNQMEELRRSYAISTKWCFIGTLPLFFVLFLFPDVVLTLLFGSRYIGAAFALQILAVGFFLNPATGPNYHTLIAMGKTKIIMQTFLISGFTNIILNIALIPSLGIVGAAIASASALAIATTMLSVKLYQFSKIHPLTRNYLKPAIISIIVVFVIYIIAKNFLIITFWTSLVLFMLFLLIYILLLLLTKSFDNEDIMILLEIEKKSGINFTLIKKFLKKFI
ncbi:MAG: polysaccharide biosynthesis C-terminal domain-containing protein, partial [Methanophagales archaeon]|nr:polysaccharide biosynthesis C-terminal domain-containing protein [Methanophagales archaeon]